MRYLIPLTAALALLSTAAFAGNHGYGHHGVTVRDFHARDSYIGAPETAIRNYLRCQDGNTHTVTVHTWGGDYTINNVVAQPGLHNVDVWGHTITKGTVVVCGRCGNLNPAGR